MSSNPPKLLVISKTIFHALHDCDEKLYEFVKNYNVVLPHTLAIECVISKPTKDPDRLMRALFNAIKAGAKLGYETPVLLEIEKNTLRPVKSVVDETNTQNFKDLTPEINEDTIRQAANLCMQVTKQKTNGLLGHARILYEKICENQTSLKNFSKPTKIDKRFKKWINYVDQNNFMSNAIKIGFGKYIGHQSNANWYTWHFTRLWYAYCLDWSHKKSLQGSCEKKDISNDLYDIEPVLYLLLADGLLTNDQKLEIPLAKAAFPQKDVLEIDTRLNNSRNVKNIYDDIVKIIPESYRNK